MWPGFLALGYGAANFQVGSGWFLQGECGFLLAWAYAGWSQVSPSLGLGLASFQHGVGGFGQRVAVLPGKSGLFKRSRVLRRVWYPKIGLPCQGDRSRQQDVGGSPIALLIPRHSAPNSAATTGEFSGACLAVHGRPGLSPRENKPGLPGNAALPQQSEPAARSGRAFTSEDCRAFFWHSLQMNLQRGVLPGSARGRGWPARAQRRRVEPAFHCPWLLATISRLPWLVF